jgi:hypothetical protein
MGTREYWTKGRIDIPVAGPAGQRRAALNVVLNDLEAVHGRNPEIGPKIVAGDHAQITVVEGAVHGSGGETQVGTRGGEGTTGSVITSWPMFSVACGFGAIVVAIVLWLIPSNEWRAIVGGLLGLGLAVTAVVLTFNPKFFYRRWLAYVIPGGLLVNALGVTLDGFVLSKWAVGSFRWDSMTSGWFFVAWAAVVWGLVWADVKQRR